MKSDEIQEALRARSSMRTALSDALVAYLSKNKDAEAEQAVTYLTSGGKLPAKYLATPSVSKVYEQVRAQFPDKDFASACTTRNDNGTG